MDLNSNPGSFTGVRSCLLEAPGPFLLARHCSAHGSAHADPEATLCEGHVCTLSKSSPRSHEARKWRHGWGHT